MMRKFSKISYRAQRVRDLQRVVKTLSVRLKHQQSEVYEAQKRYGSFGYGRKYLNRMKVNCYQTKKVLQYYSRQLRYVK